MKDLQKLTGAKIISKKEQQSIKGGYSGQCGSDNDCFGRCIGGECAPARENQQTA